MTAPGTKKQNLDRRFDQTQLRESGHGQRVHRDYAAHFFRWGFAAKFVKPGMKVLDLGCGQDLPLHNTLSSSLSTVPQLYVGVDLNRINRRGAKWATIKDEFNFIDRYQEVIDDHGKFDVITCFEMIEHMHAVDGQNLLRAARRCLADGGKFLLSTPVYNGKRMAANHIKEYTIDELRTQISDAGLKITERYGTFASWPEIKKVLTEGERKLYEQLNRYYSHEVLSCFLAPKYPDASRNNIWILEK